MWRGGNRFGFLPFRLAVAESLVTAFAQFDASAEFVARNSRGNEIRSWFPTSGLGMVRLTGEFSMVHFHPSLPVRCIRAA